MSAVIPMPEIYIRPMIEQDVISIINIEKNSYDFPWSETIFQDCLRAGYSSWVIENNKILIGYGIMLITSDESHILNLCVHPDYQSMGVGKQLLDYFLFLARRQNIHRIFLEVRPTNFRAIKLYISMGFNEIGKRRNYYPTKIGREDALILAKTLLKEEL
ncbi:MAG: ribosomal protein S18-alanine N-acetyltransferase [Pseudomonadota bacterium]|nr:ribosomal protein S18-alanine N-acetyltransferase [Pseudomonadota bacterium]|tara:strand:- start:3454 stop:3933 length:480 start_codon:yes stop_codon:yes gene_type:complete